MLQNELIFPIGLCFLFSGIVKGLTGLGFLTLCISLLVFFVELQVAMGLVIIASVASNIFVIMEAGNFKNTTKQFWLLYATSVPGLLIGLQILLAVDQKNLQAN